MFAVRAYFNCNAFEFANLMIRNVYYKLHPHTRTHGAKSFHLLGKCDGAGIRNENKMILMIMTGWLSGPS